MQEKVVVVSTGGTFDKIYNWRSETMSFDGQPRVLSVLEEARVCEFDHELLWQDDSAKYGEEHRSKIAGFLKNLNCYRILVIHGTSSMVETAKAVYEALPDKVTVFTGAMVPFSHLQSEASFNVGFALASARTLEAGAWIAMNGRVLDPFDCFKDETNGVFRALSEERKNP